MLSSVKHQVFSVFYILSDSTDRPEGTKYRLPSTRSVSIALLSRCTLRKH